MGRIKGWRIYSKRPTEVVYEGLVGGMYRGMVRVVFRHDVWEVQIWRYANKNYEIQKFFKTKAQALKFARSWMRKHPNG